MSDTALSASFSQAFEVGTIVIPTSTVSKTKHPQLLQSFITIPCGAFAWLVGGGGWEM